MLTRRNFAQMLAAIPFLNFAKPKKALVTTAPVTKKEVYLSNVREIKMVLHSLEGSKVVVMQFDDFDVQAALQLTFRTDTSEFVRAIYPDRDYKPMDLAKYSPDTGTCC